MGGGGLTWRRCSRGGLQEGGTQGVPSCSRMRAPMARSSAPDFPDQT